MLQKILIVDDNTMVRRHVRWCIEKHTTWHVCGEAENGRTAVEMVIQFSPDIVILDFQMPVMNGLEAARRITLVAPKTAMVMLTMHESEQLAKAAKAAGIKEVLSKSGYIHEHLLTSLRSIAANN